ncbi:Pyrin and HIN domain-containing protein 1 [Fukomys damarensis]|uniref:Pyrin and HIN domain-containing protein 1 n=1 Tax=Fukomys damarensis TaxID=885580 RepID=A0A091DGH9_FUKDA|nr:Pyrin and HIN domain-containing protein 1 [Fukomys damarensis]
MPSTPPTTLQTPQMAPETPSSSQQMPKMAPEPSNRLHTVMMLPAAASSSLQTGQRPPRPPSNLQPLWMPPTASSPLVVSKDTVQVSPDSTGISSTIQQSPDSTETSGNIQQSPDSTDASRNNNQQSLTHVEAKVEVCTHGTFQRIRLSERPQRSDGVESDRTIYAVREEEQKIIHATVATKDEFFRVKVFDVTFKDKFPQEISLPFQIILVEMGS